MGKLLDEAIADANRVRTLAIENAKAAIAETFQPQIQRMVSAKIAEEDELSGDDLELSEEDYVDDGQDGTPADNLSEEGAEELDDDFQISETELDSMISELEGEEDGEFDFNYFDFGDLGGEEELGGEDLGGEEEPLDDLGGEDLGGEEEPLDDLGGEEELGGEDLGGEEDEDVIESLIRGMKREMRENSNNRKTVKNTEKRHPVKPSTQSEVAQLTRKLQEATRANSVLRKAINEVNLLNAKLMYATKIIRNYKLTQSQQEKVLEAFDRSKTVNDASMIYKTLSGQFTSGTKARSKSKSIANPKKVATRPITENRAPVKTQYDFADRWKVIAGIKAAEL